MRVVEVSYAIHFKDGWAFAVNFNWSKTKNFQLRNVLNVKNASIFHNYC